MKRFKKILSVLLAAVLFSGIFSSGLAWADNSGKQDAVNTPDRLIVVYDKESSLEFVKYTAENFSEVNCVKVTDLTIDLEEKIKKDISEGVIKPDSDEIAFNKILCLYVDLEQGDLEDVIELLKGKKGVLYVEPDYMLKLERIPGDSYYSNQWGNEIINLPAAWEAETGSSSVTVGVIDSGIDSTHPDLIGRLNTSLSRDFLSGVAVADNAPTDDCGHGTHVAGIIGARSNNNIGVSGVCWNVRMVSLKVFNETGVGYASNAIAAISYAESIGLDILNLSGSYGRSVSASDSQPSLNAMNTAISNYSGLFVCAAGNDGTNIDTYSHNIYPAVCTAANIITVGASTSTDSSASFSNYGATSVDLFAPGYNILSTFPVAKCLEGTCDASTHFQNGYHYMNGTSMAAPYVAGVAALIKAAHPDITTSQLKSAILNNTDFSSALSGKCVTNGRLNAYKALESTHHFSYTNVGDDSYHECECSICGYTVNKPHEWEAYRAQSSVDGDELQYVPRYICRKCGAITLTPDSTNNEILSGDSLSGLELSSEPNCGTINGYGVWFVPTNLQAVESKLIAGYTFTYNTSFVIVVVKGENRYRLEEAYKNGLLTEEDIATVYKKFSDLSKTPDLSE